MKDAKSFTQFWSKPTKKTQANLYVIQTKQDDPQRLVFKKKLYELGFYNHYA